MKSQGICIWILSGNPAYAKSRFPHDEDHIQIIKGLDEMGTCIDTRTLAVAVSLHEVLMQTKG